MEVTCDSCKAKFKIKLKTDIINIDNEKIYKNYFNCKKCKAEYIVLYENDKCIELKNKITKYRNEKHDKKIINNLVDENKKEMVRLKSIAEGDKK